MNEKRNITTTKTRRIFFGGGERGVVFESFYFKSID
jgi:hypothetical protein